VIHRRESGASVNVEEIKEVDDEYNQQSRVINSKKKRGKRRKRNKQ
jgi:hypothetical protein